jgi:hypothetical protein
VPENVDPGINYHQLPSFNSEQTIGTLPSITIRLDSHDCPIPHILRYFSPMFWGWDTRQKAEEAEEHARRQVPRLRWALGAGLGMDHLAPSGTTRVLEVQDYHWATAKQLQELEETWLISDDLG